MLGTKSADTYFASAMGFGTIGVGSAPLPSRVTCRASAMRSRGQRLRRCSRSLSPSTWSSCDGNNRPIDSGHPWARHVVHKVPLCSNSPGQRRMARLVPARQAERARSVCSIENPNNPPFDLPSWQYVMPDRQRQWRRRNCDGEVTGLGGRRGPRIQRPDRLSSRMFDVTCGPANNTEPDHTPGEGSSRTTAARQMISTAETATTSGIGSRALPTSSCAVPAPPTAAGLEGAYMQGNNRPICESGGNGATSCLVGTFVDILGSGTVGAGSAAEARLGQGARCPVDQIAPALAAGKQEQDRRRRAGRRGVSVWADHRVPPAAPFGLCIRAPIQGSV